ncbi:MAG: Fe-S cluster assembly protein SufB, partial [Bacteroidales bacterium]|nr:Fe-S cluster assembly protein SufB [Bacteroidales bacterium]
MSETNEKNIINELESSTYEAGFVTDIEMETFPKGLNEDVIRRLSALRNEPPQMLDFRLRAYEKWKTMTMPRWAHLQFQEPDYQDLIYYAAPKKKPKLNSL